LAINRRLALTAATLLVLSTSISAWPALALDLTVGQLTTCAVWLQERSELKSWIKRPDPNKSYGPMPTGTQITGTWVIGYIEGYDKGCLHDEPITKGPDTEALFVRLDGICRSKTQPEHYPLSLAADALIKQLDPDHDDVCMQGLK
jgi:hypothetical protein